jgi:hypothetical protein
MDWNDKEWCVAPLVAGFFILLIMAVAVAGGGW